MSLYASDYTAAEKTFQLLTQAAGRAGRGDGKADVVIQTYAPDNYSIQCSMNQDYEMFYNEEIAYRRLMQYPPVAYMMVILITSDNKQDVETSADNLIEVIKELKKDRKAEMTIVIGPADASVAKINDVFRKVIYLKHVDNNILIYVKDRLEEIINDSQNFKNVGVQFDFNPSGNY